MLESAPNSSLLALLWRERIEVRVVRMEFALTLPSPATREGNS